MAKKKKPVDEPKKKAKFKAKSRIEDDEDDADDNDDDGIVRTPKVGNDAYTGMLVISLVCLLTACVFLFLDQGEVTAQPLSAPNVTIDALGKAVAAPAAPAAAAMPAAAADGR